jgi:hypothetical protein
VLLAGHVHDVWRRRIRGVDMRLVGDWPDVAGHWVEGWRDGRLAAVARVFTDLRE